MPFTKKKAPTKAKVEPKPKATPKPKASAKPKAEPADTREWLTVVCTSDSLTLTFPTKEARGDAIERLTVALGSTYRGQAIEIIAEEGIYLFADTQLCYLNWD
jgi:hypothetical protein